MTRDRITGVDAVEVALPLPQPLHLGPLLISDRRYVVVTVTTDGGHVGHAVALTRGAPVAACINEMLAPIVVGGDPLRTVALWDAMFRGTIAAGRTGAVMRAISLVDIALWDVKGKRAGLPVWALLGGAASSVELMLVGGYPRADLAPQELGERVAGYARDGFRLVKVARAPDPAVTAAVLDAARRDLPVGAGLVVDAAWAYDDVEHALGDIAVWGPEAVAWLEDPLPPENTAACARLARLAPVALGIGDDVTDEHVLHHLIASDAVRMVRLDAASVGGITAAARVAAVAHAAGLPVSFHVYPHVHVHLAAGLPGRHLLESFDPLDNPFDPCQDLLVGGPDLRAGTARPPSTPGLGFELDDERVAHHLVATPPTRPLATGMAASARLREDS